jgi:hypothetical protein
LIAELFGVDIRTVNEHLKNIYADGELVEEATIRKNRIVQKEGNREVGRDVLFYNLDAIISVGYRVNSIRATQFRQWATGVLRNFAIRGYVLDKERLKNGTFLNEEYFDHLLEEIREIRASERKFYQKSLIFMQLLLIITRRQKQPRISIRLFRTSCILQSMAAQRQRSFATEQTAQRSIWD